ncbi:MAG: hypothetical protein WCH31_00810 [Actinomycetes bacterium]
MRTPTNISLTTRLLTLVSASAAAVTLMASSASGTTNRTLYVGYNGTSITMTLANGTPLTQGMVIPPGPYDFVFHDSSGDPNIAIQGPGLTSFIIAVPSDSVATRTLQPNSTYTYHDDNFPSSPPVTFFTSAPVADTQASAVTAMDDTNPSNTTVIGASTTPRGTLVAKIDTTDTPTLLAHGKPVTKLVPGRYAVVLSDRSKKSGFLLQKSGHAALRLTAPSFIGSRTVHVTLTKGRWLFYAANNARLSFVVAG